MVGGTAVAGGISAVGTNAVGVVVVGTAVSPAVCVGRTVTASVGSTGCVAAGVSTATTVVGVKVDRNVGCTVGVGCGPDTNW